VPPGHRCAGRRTAACWPALPAGLASYFGVDVTIIRIVMAVLAVLAIAGNAVSIAGLPLSLAGIPLYLACWLLIPAEGQEHSIAVSLLRSR